MRVTWASAAEILPGAWLWPHIDPAREWADSASGALVVETEFLSRLESLRADLGWPLIITSGYRTPAHNAAISTTGEDGPHTTGRAVDIKIHGSRALELIAAATDLGFTGFGLQQRGPVGTRYVHLDDLPSTLTRPRPWVWTY